MKANSFKELHSNIRDLGARLVQSRDTSAVANDKRRGLNAEEFGEEAMHYSQLQNLFDGRE